MQAYPEYNAASARRMLEWQLEAAFDVRGIVGVLAWVLLAFLLRSKICHAAKLTTLAAGIVLGVAWSTVHFVVGLVAALQTVAELARKHPTPVDISLGLDSLLRGVLVSVLLSIAGAFVLRSTLGHPRPDTAANDQRPGDTSSEAT